MNSQALLKIEHLPPLHKCIQWLQDAHKTILHIIVKMQLLMKIPEISPKQSKIVTVS